MVATGCDSEEAFGCLRRCSQDANLKLHQVAHRLVQAVGPDQRGGDFVLAFLVGMAQSSPHSP